MDIQLGSAVKIASVGLVVWSVLPLSFEMSTYCHNVSITVSLTVDCTVITTS